MKACNKCGIPKELDDFSPDKGKSDGRKGKCKKCTNAMARKRLKDIEEGKIKVVPRVKKIIRNKILCLRSGEYIRKVQCVPGCNDACSNCDNKQLTNIAASADTFTPDQEANMRHQGAFRSSAAVAVEDGYIDREG